MFETDDDLAIGEFGIATRMVHAAAEAARDEPRVRGARPGATMIYRPSAGGRPRPRRPASSASSAEAAALDASNGARHELDGARVVLGRSKDCDMQVADPNVSRRHAEVRQEGATSGSSTSTRRTASR